MPQITKGALERTRERLRESAEKAKRQERFEALTRGEVTIPLRCGFCASSSLTSDLEGGKALCAACGRSTDVEAAHRCRRQEIRAYIERGVV